MKDGCDYCLNRFVLIYSVALEMYVVIKDEGEITLQEVRHSESGDAQVVEIDSKVINYCPMCSRQLNELLEPVGKTDKLEGECH